MVEILKVREERELEHFEHLAKKHNYDWWGHQTKAASLRFQRRINLLKEHVVLTPNCKILECGCGSGDFTLSVAKTLNLEYVSYYAIELSDSQIKIAKEKLNNYRLNIVKGSISNIPFESNYFNYIIGNSILHHLELPLALKEIKRVLMYGGKVIFFEPNLLNPVVWLMFNVKPFRKLHQASPDEKAFSKRQIKKELEIQGFSNVEVKPFDFIFPLFPSPFLNTARKVEKVLEQTLLREIAGSLFICALKENS